MKIIVTGAAGFIGSHLCERLLQDPKTEVLGIDCFIGPTASSLKQRNILKLQHEKRFKLVTENLLTIDWDIYLRDADMIYHLAGLPGVRSSWGNEFEPYVSHNILVTQKLLEAVRKYPIKKLVYASTSSIYGEKSGKVSETSMPMPLSPYGVTKLTGEHLCHVYHQNDGVPIVVLRFFTVYGERQRPDMAFHRFIKHFIENKPIKIFGDGTQTRDFTYVTDCAEATASIVRAEDAIIGETINVGGKERASVLDAITILEEIFQRKAQIEFLSAARGEPKHTWADISKAEKLLSYMPKIDLKQGLKKEVEFLQNIY